MSNSCPEMLTDCTVNYTIEKEGRLFVVENVPARVNLATGEQLFSAKTVEKIQELLRGNTLPSRMMETAVYQYLG